MTPNLPNVTALYAAVLGLLAAFLTVRVIVTRVRLKVDAGDGGNPTMQQAIRAHANLTEHVPIALILIALAEAGGARPLAIHVLGAALVVARVASAWGLSHTLSLNGAGRKMGAGLTVLLITAASLLILARSAGL
jgi:uncharacterized protein